MNSDNDEHKEDEYFDDDEQNLNELTKLTNFSLLQIDNFRKYFRKCKKKPNKQKSDNNSELIDVLDKEEFKVSLGVLSTKSCDYISNRLFEVVTGEGKEYLSFREYILKKIN